MALLATWMGRLAPLLGNSTLLDLTLPGAHDAMTYDLSTTLSDGYEGLGPVLSKLLHGLSPLVAGEFVRQQGQTQGLNVTAMLDHGIRFIDFRIMFTDAPGGIFDRDWFCLHGCQTVRTAISYLREVHAWMEAHPTEILVFWASRHGDDQATGDDAYPSTTAAQRQLFWSEVNSTFGPMLFDSSTGALNATPVAELLRRGQRLVWLANDWVQSTGRSPRALDAAAVLHNQLSGASDDFPRAGAAQAASFRTAALQRTVDARAGKLWLLSMAAGPPEAAITRAAMLHFLRLLPAREREEQTRACAADYRVPGLAEWCPPTLMDVSLLVNYYAQRTLEQAYRELSRAHLELSNKGPDLPHAIYIDGIAEGGTIRTGTALLSPLWRQASSASAKGGHGPNSAPERAAATVEEQEDAAAAMRRRLDDGHATTSYAFVATLLGANVRRLCAARRSDSVSDMVSACASLLAEVEAARALAPLTLWNDTARGRRLNWP